MRRRSAPGWELGSGEVMSSKAGGTARTAGTAGGIFGGAFHEAPAPLAVVTLGPGGPRRIVEANTALCRLLGRGPEELAGSDLGSLLVSERAASAAQRAPATGSLGSFEASCRRPGGDPVRCLVRWSLLQRRPRALAVVEVQELAAADARGAGEDGAGAAGAAGAAGLAEAQRVAGIGSWEWEIDSDRVTWSREVFRMFGLDEQNGPLMGARFGEVLHPADRERVTRLVTRSLRSRSDFEYEARLLRPNGTIRSVEVMGRVVAEAGRARRVVGTVQDVTARRHVADAFEAAEGRLAHGYDRQAAGIALLRLGADDQGCILEVRGELWRSAGYRREEIVGHRIDELLADGPDLRELSALFPVSESLVGFEARLLLWDGGTIRVRANGYRTEAQGRAELVVIEIRELRDSEPSADRAAATPELSAREAEILQLVADGHSGPEIARKLYLSPETVKSHLSHTYGKLGVHERAAAVAEAMRRDLIL